MAESTDRPQGANAYSIYVNRDTDATQVNWGQIAKELTDGANAIRDSREAQKSAIDEATRKAMDDLSKIAGVDNQSLGKLLINGSDYSKKTLAENMELLRSGLLDPKDYQLIMQSQLDGYKNLSEYVKGADAKYQEAMARLEAGEDGATIASDLEMAWNEGTFGFGDLRNKRLITNPRNGELVLVTMVDDGQGNLVMPDPDKRPDLYQNTAYLNVRTDFKQDRRDTNNLANNVVDSLADVITSSVGAYSAIGGGGVVTSIQDFRQLFNDDKMKEYLSLENDDGTAMTYDQFMDDQINTITGDASDLSSMNAAQVLSGAGYKFVQSAEEAKQKGISKYVIYKNVNGSPQVELTEAQMKEARNIAKRAIESRIDLKIKQSQPDTGEQVNKESPGEIAGRTKREKTSAYIRDINKVLTDPDVATSEATLRTLVTNINEQRASGGRPRINDIDITDDAIVVTYETGEPTIIERTRRDNTGAIIGQTTTNEDIGALYQLLVPGAQAEGGELALSPSQIEAFIQREDIRIGDRGVNRFLGYEQDIQAPEVLTDQTAVAKPDGTTITTNQFWNEVNNFAENELGEELDRGAIDSDSDIAAVANKYMEQFTTIAASQAQAEAGFSSIRVEVTGDGDNRKAVLKYSVGGEEKQIEVGEIPNGTTTRRYGQMVVDAYNKLNEEAFKVRGARGQTIRPTYNSWLASKGLNEGNAALYQQYLQEHPLRNTR